MTCIVSVRNYRRMFDSSAGMPIQLNGPRRHQRPHGAKRLSAQSHQPVTKRRTAHNYPVRIIKSGKRGVQQRRNSHIPLQTKFFLSLLFAIFFFGC
jgi:hypothetical protein